MRVRLKGLPITSAFAEALLGEPHPTVQSILADLYDLEVVGHGLKSKDKSPIPPYPRVGVKRQKELKQTAMERRMADWQRMTGRG